jgi:hypothetical protein
MKGGLVGWAVTTAALVGRGVGAVVTREVGAGVVIVVGAGVTPAGDPDREFINVNAPAITMTTMMASAATAIRDVLFGAGGDGMNAGPEGGDGGAASASAVTDNTGESVEDRTGHFTSGATSGVGDSLTGAGGVMVSWWGCGGI